MNRHTALIVPAGLISLLFAGGCAATSPQRPEAMAAPQPQSQLQPVAMVVPTTAPAGTDSNLFGINISGGLVGKKCRLQFRRDALGLSAPGLLEPTATQSGGKSTSLVGVVDQVSDAWLVIRANNRLYWVPVQQILMVEVVE
jgi:hypothetical protein